MLGRDVGTRAPAGDWTPRWVGDVFARAGYCGGSFDGGLLRFHDAASGPEGVELVGAAFGGIIASVGLFAFDWLGRQYAVIDPAQGDGTGPDVVVFDLGVGEVRLLATLDDVTADLDNGTIVEILEAGAFAAWQRSAGGGPLDFSECAGFVHPPFLGGDESIDNLARSDISVYWHVVGSLYARTRDAPEGTVVTDVSAAEKP